MSMNELFTYHTCDVVLTVVVGVAGFRPGFGDGFRPGFGDGF